MDPLIVARAVRKLRDAALIELHPTRYAQFPTDKPFIDGAAYAQGPVNAPKMDSVLSDFDAGLQQLASQDPKAILARLQKNTQAAIGG